MLAASYQRNRLLSGLLVGFGVLFLLFVLGYGIGKDLAYRDAAVAKARWAPPADSRQLRI